MVRRADLRNKTRKGRLAPADAPAPVVEAPAPEPVVEVVDEVIDLDTLLKSELIALAEERGLDVTGTKAELIARLSEVEDGDDGGEEEE
jgi:hypothetical protein